MSDTTKDLPSGRFVLRIEPEHHAALRAAAEACGLSLNEYCARRLAGPGISAGGAAREAVQRGIRAAGDALVGVVAFGSWSRGRMADTSDVDLLLVLDRATPIRRSLYRTWDADPLRWEGHRVEPHFVHLPEPDADVSGLWAEAAIDGVVLFERAFGVSRALVEIRRRILDGHLVRRRCHGHPYWVRAA